MKVTVQPSAGMQSEPSLTLYSFEKQNRKGSVEKAQWGIARKEAVHRQQPGAAPAPCSSCDQGALPAAPWLATGI